MSGRNRPIKNMIESEQNFKVLVESARDAIIVIQNDIIKFANPYANKIYGASLNKIIEQSFIKFVHPDSLEMVKKRYTDWRNGKKVPNYFQVDLIDFAEEKRICEISSSTIVFEGLPSELVIIHDITKRKRAEELLRKSEKKFSSIVESSPMGMHLYSLKPDGKLIFSDANPAADVILGVDNSQFIGKTIEEAFPQLADTEVPQKYRLVAEKGESWQTEQIVYEDEKISGAFEVHTFQTSPGKMVAAFMDVTKRKLMEDRIRKSEELNRSITQMAADAIICIDDNGIILSWNKSAEKIFGYSETEVKNKNLTIILPAKYKTEHINGIKRLQSGGKENLIGKTIEITALRKNGTEFPIELSLSSWEADNRKYFTGIIRDITKRKHAEEEIKFLSEITQQASDSIITTDLNFTITWVNDAFIELFGYEFEEIVGKSPDILNADPLATKIQEEIYKTVIAGRKYKGEALNKKKDGSVFKCEFDIFPIFNESGDIFAYSGHQRDITERKQVEEVLKESETKYKEIATSMPGVVYQFKIRSDGSYEFPYMDESSERFFQQNSKDIEADPNLFFNMVPPEDLKSFIDSIEKTRKTMKEWRHNFRLVLPDGQTRWFEGRSIPHLLPSDEPLWNGVVIDVTERKRVEEKLINRNKELELFNEVTVGRELKMIELKKEINELLEKSGEKPKYDIPV